MDSGVLESFSGIWLVLFSAVGILAALYTSGRALLFKRDSRSAIAWVGFIWVLPVAGPIFYWLFGINRIRSKARILRADMGSAEWHKGEGLREPAALVGELPARTQPLARLVDAVSPFALQGGNQLRFLENGDQAYPAMLAAIAEAKRSITLATYIFDRDALGLRFVAALAAARAKGVEVRVLIDGVGVHYSRPSIVPELTRRGVPVGLFLPTLIPSRLPYMNLRNHRKLLVVDGQLAFTGGMNIRAGHLLEGRTSADAIVDMQVELQGPIVADLQRSFVEDWFFSNNEILDGPAFFPALPPLGQSVARVVPDGPDNRTHAVALTLKGALSTARERVRIVTPYFVPDPTLVSALGVAALRGVQVQIVLPERGNLSLVQWASTAQLWQMLEPGCEIYLSPPPFDHTKLMVVDDLWTFVGSANWDARSLRLNFELNVECYDPAIAAQAHQHAVQRISGAQRLTLDEVDGRSLPIRLRDGLARLATPYL